MKARWSTRLPRPLCPSGHLENEHNQGSYPDHDLISRFALLYLLKRNGVGDRQRRRNVSPALDGFPSSCAKLSQ